MGMNIGTITGFFIIVLIIVILKITELFESRIKERSVLYFFFHLFLLNMVIVFFLFSFFKNFNSSDFYIPIIIINIVLIPFFFKQSFRTDTYDTHETYFKNKEDYSKILLKLKSKHKYEQSYYQEADKGSIDEDEDANKYYYVDENSDNEQSGNTESNSETFNFCKTDKSSYIKYNNQSELNKDDYSKLFFALKSKHKYEQSYYQEADKGSIDEDDDENKVDEQSGNTESGSEKYSFCKTDENSGINSNNQSGFAKESMDKENKQIGLNTKLEKNEEK